MKALRERIALDVPPTAHDYLLGDGILRDLGGYLSAVAAAGPCALVTDEGVAATSLLLRAQESLAGAGFAPEVVLVPSGEAAKTVAEAERLWNRFADAGIERGGVVVALGGGAVTDLAGFCAATWLRGVAFVPVPTTLLGMADSAVGGKTGIDLASGKNLVGAFHLPELVLADLDALDTLPERQLRSGFAEIVKCAVLAERAALAMLRERAGALLARDHDALADAVLLAVRVKERHVRDDPRDAAGVRALLNLGHTTAHGLEAETGFGAMLHGEAVAVGLVAATHVAVARGLCDERLAEEVRTTLEVLGLPTRLPGHIEPERVLDRTRLDKKRAGGRCRMVLPLTEGGAGLVEVESYELLAALQALRPVP